MPSHHQVKLWLNLLISQATYPIHLKTDLDHNFQPGRLSRAQKSTWFLEWVRLEFISTWLEPDSNPYIKSNPSFVCFVFSMLGVTFPTSPPPPWLSCCSILLAVSSHHLVLPTSHHLLTLSWSSHYVSFLASLFLRRLLYYPIILLLDPFILPTTHPLFNPCVLINPCLLPPLSPFLFVFFDYNWNIYIFLWRPVT